MCITSINQYLAIFLNNSCRQQQQAACTNSSLEPTRPSFISLAGTAGFEATQVVQAYCESADLTISYKVPRQQPQLYHNLMTPDSMGTREPLCAMQTVGCKTRCRDTKIRQSYGYTSLQVGCPVNRQMGVDTEDCKLVNGQKKANRQWLSSTQLG